MRAHTPCDPVIRSDFCALLAKSLLVAAVALGGAGISAASTLTVPLSSGLVLPLPGENPGFAWIKPGGELARLDGNLLKLLSDYRRHQQQSKGEAFHPGNRLLRFSRGRVLVDARTSTDGASLLHDLERLGLTGGSHFGPVVSGWLPVGALHRASALDSLGSLSASMAMTRAGSVQSQGDIAQYSDIARSVEGVDGTGIKIGILSDSYDQQAGAAADIASGDLPAGVEVLDDSAVCDDGIFVIPCTDEGRGMMQILHDVAPGADLAFHTAFNGFSGFANGIVDLADAGADVIVDDVIFLSEPMFSDGVIARAVDQVEAAGVSYFSAAGNQARDSYHSGFVNSGEMLLIDVGPPFGEVEAGFMHDFDPGPGVDTLQAHTIPAGQCAIFSVQWDSPFGSEAAGTGTQNDLDIWLVNDAEDSIVAFDAHENIPTGEPVEAMIFCNDGLYAPTNPPVFKLIVALWEGAEPGLFKSVLFGGASIDEHATHSGTVYGHANAEGAIAVGAAYYQDTPAYGTSPPVLESFSSAGGDTPILFAADGTRIPAQYRLAPSIVAPDGVDTTFFYVGSDRNGNGTPDFSGTSAAAPHAAGVAALMLQRSPLSSPASIRAALESTALDMLTPGYDDDSGFGLIRADRAVADVEAGNPPPVAAFGWEATGLEVQFTDTSSDDGSVASWGWDFGDGNGSAAQHPVHTYAEAGTYSVTLSVTDDDGNMASISQSVSVEAAPGGVAPSAQFSYSCNKLVCDFDASGSSDDGTIVNYAWDFGDSNSSSGAESSVSHAYLSPGSFNVTLTVADNEGYADDASLSVDVKAKGKSSGDSSSGGDGGSDGGGNNCPPAKADKGKC